MHLCCVWDVYQPKHKKFKSDLCLNINSQHSFFVYRNIEVKITGLGVLGWILSTVLTAFHSIIKGPITDAINRQLSDIFPKYY
jgi:hypothetical protein